MQFLYFFLLRKNCRLWLAVLIVGNIGAAGAWKWSGILGPSRLVGARSKLAAGRRTRLSILADRRHPPRIPHRPADSPFTTTISADRSLHCYKLVSRIFVVLRFQYFRRAPALMFKLYLAISVGVYYCLLCSSFIRYVYKTRQQINYHI